MRIKSGFVLEQVGGTYLAVAVGERADEFRILIKLNSTGAFLWKIASERDVGTDELVDELVASYDVSCEVAERDVMSFVKILSDGGLLDE